MMGPSEPSPPPVLEKHDTAPVIEALPIAVPTQEESNPPVIHAAPDIVPEGELLSMPK